ncbi:hypothetical protein [Virgisporangium aurantiacum]|uniref:hypothetical protein n=1 Tax=Virgisporangium aurantiacum TaxID=175570 RepID=UPI001950025F|nr:hypothetical protein [Virgisporangium aurantiacum]
MNQPINQLSNGGPTPPTIGEIADLLAQARSLSEQGRDADPQKRAAFGAAKASLLARINHSTGTGTAEDGES